MSDEEVKEEVKTIQTPFQNVISIGDISLGSSEDSLSSCSKTIKKLFRDEHITKYLNGNFSRKKILGNSGIG